MSGTPPDIVEIIQRALESRLSDVYTAMPGRIEAYDSATQCADISPGVKRVIFTEDDEPTEEEYPILPNVPILFPRGGAFSITWPLVKGDYVTVLIMTASISKWRATGVASAPGDLRMHALGNAVALPALAPNAQHLDPALAADASLCLTGDVKIGGHTASDFIPLASKIMANLNAIKNAAASAVIVPMDGGAALKAALAGVVFQEIASTKGKVL